MDRHNHFGVKLAVGVGIIGVAVVALGVAFNSQVASVVTGKSTVSAETVQEEMDRSTPVGLLVRLQVNKVHNGIYDNQEGRAQELLERTKYVCQLDDAGLMQYIKTDMNGTEPIAKARLKVMLEYVCPSKAEGFNKLF